MNKHQLKILDNKKLKAKCMSLAGEVTVYKDESLKTWDFYKSEKWQSLRKKMLKKKRHRCELCGCGESLHVHHKKYRMFKPWTHLQVLCKWCHAKKHPVMAKQILK